MHKAEGTTAISQDTATRQKAARAAGVIARAKTPADRGYRGEVTRRPVGSRGQGPQFVIRATGKSEETPLSHDGKGGLAYGGLSWGPISRPWSRFVLSGATRKRSS